MNGFDYKNYVVTYASGNYGLKKRIIRKSKTKGEYEDLEVILSNSQSLETVCERLTKEVASDECIDVSFEKYLDVLNTTKLELNEMLKTILKWK